MAPVVCAIHQPNFFPWLGYFDKIRRADVFVFLDAVDYPRAGSGGMGSWTNRVRVRSAAGLAWLGCPVRRLPLGAPILNAHIDEAQPWRRKALRALETNYGRAARFRHAMDLIEPLLAEPDDRLAEFNMRVVQRLAEACGLSTRFLRQSELGVDTRATDLLVAITRAVGADAYLAGGGAAGYQEDHLFAEAGVALVFQNFQPAPYGPEPFTPGLSIIDYLMHDGRPLGDVSS